MHHVRWRAALVAAPWLLFALPQASHAQAIQADVVSSCGSVTYSAGQTNHVTMDTTGKVCDGGAGGGGGGAVYGPTAVGSAAANPPVLTAGTANATATGNVQVIKVDSSGFQHVVAETGSNTIGNVGLVAGSAVIGHVIADTGSTTAVTSLPALAAGTATIGTISPLGVTTTDKAGTITTGGTAQTAIASNASRRGWCIQNPSTATESLYVRVNGTASATTGIELTAGAEACNQTDIIDTAAVSVFAATTAHAFKGFEVQ